MSLKPAKSLEPALWVKPSTQNFAKDVLSLVPGNFEAYIRILHPAYQVTGSEENQITLRWSEVAERKNRVAHRLMQWHNIRADEPTVYDYTSLKPDDVWLRNPKEDSPPSKDANVLAKLLTPHTKTPQDCFFAVWEGYTGCLGEPITGAPTFDMPNRTYYLLEGPVTKAHESICTGYIDNTSDALHQGPNLWWPIDHAWFVYSAVDFNSTYVGVSVEGAESILLSEELEAYLVEPTDSIMYDSDTINPSGVRD